MAEAIVVALITSAASIIGIIITSSVSSKGIHHKLDKALAVQETKLTELTREVREHNGFARRMPVVEEQIKVANCRIEALEREARKK